MGLVTQGTRSCERCQTAPVHAVTLLGEMFQGRYCSGCAEQLHSEQERQERDRLARLRLDMSGVTPRQQRFTWEQASRPDVGRDWLARRAGNLILFGSVGSGKTGLAALIVRDLCADGVAARLVNMRNLLADMREAMRDGAAASLAGACARVRVLALDDLGAERTTAWALDELATIVDRRYEAELPTIVTSNYDLDKLAGRLSVDGDPVIGQRIASRLAEHAQQVNFDMPDRRLGEAA